MAISSSRAGESQSTYHSQADNIVPNLFVPWALEIHGCLDRLEALLIDEYKALIVMSLEEIRSINARKSALLLELDRGQRAHKAVTLDPVTVERLRTIRVKLEQNMQHISRHVAALNEVVGVVRRSVQRSEADGTYSRIAQADAWVKCSRL